MKAIAATIISILILTVSIFAEQNSFSDIQTFTNAKVGNNQAGNWKADRPVYYKVAEKDGNKFLQIRRTKSIDYFINEEPQKEKVTDFSVSFKVCIHDFPEKESSTLVFAFRALNIANAFAIHILNNRLQILDMDQTDPKYMDLEYNRKVIAEVAYPWQENRWYQIDIVSETIKTFQKNEQGFITGGVRNRIYVNGKEMLSVDDFNTWFYTGQMFFYAWDISASVDEIKISNDPEVYKPKAPFELDQMFFQNTAKEEKLNADKSDSGSNGNEKGEGDWRIYIVISSLAILVVLILIIAKLKIIIRRNKK